ncbi:MAG: hypothetical protein OHK0045_15150 [Raineya sp.]
MISACKDDGKKEDKKEEKKEQKVGKEFKANFDILNAMPAPMEIVDLVKSTGIEYDNAILNKSENTEKYNSEYKMAMNMGIYTVDLGYANLHNKTQDAIKYLDATKKMADALKVNQFFDFAKIKSITEEGKDLNELIITTGIGLDNMRQGLEEEKRSETITLIVAAGWLEALYLATQVAEKSDRAELKERIADQKLIVVEFLKIFEANKDTSKHLADVYEDFKKINDAFANISVKNEEGKGVQVEMSKEDLKKLSKTIQEVRNKFIS